MTNNQKSLRVYLDQKTKENFEKKSRSLGISPSTYLRMLIFKFLSEKSENKGKNSSNE